VADSLIAVERSPWELLSRAAPSTSQPWFLWEAPGAEAIAALGAAARVSASGPGRFREVRAGLARAFREIRRDRPSEERPLALGGFSFVPHEAGAAPEGLPDAFFFIPERLWVRRPGEPTLESRWIPHGDSSPPLHGETPRPHGSVNEDRASWTRAVSETLRRIRSGTFSKAVLARSIEIDLAHADLLRIAASLRASYPACYRFLLCDGRGHVFLGASPERLVRLSRREILTEAVAGTIRCEPQDEEGTRAELLERSAKDRAEQRIVLDHVTATLAPLASTVEAPDEPEVMRLRHLLHLRTRVRAVAAERTAILDLVERLHPTPAVAGWPPRESLAWIRSIEPRDRGWYAGPIGWLDAEGDGDFAVGIRSACVEHGRARIFAGAGIVEGSDPDLEWTETELKMKGMLDALAGR